MKWEDVSLHLTGVSLAMGFITAMVAGTWWEIIFFGFMLGGAAALMQLDRRKQKR